MPTNQSSRFIELKSSLSRNDIRLRSVTGQEQMSRLFNYTLEIVCVDNEISEDDLINKLVGQSVTVRLDLADGSSERYFNGYISRIRSDYSEDLGVTYRAEMVPKLWFATKTSDCRIFQDQTPFDVVKVILDDNGVSFDDSHVSNKGPTREYIVQYRETDFNFISRILEQYGIGYYFTHEDGSHKVVFFDNVGGYFDNPESDVSYFLSRQEGRIHTDHITDWERQFSFVSGKYVQTDFNFEDALSDLKTNQETIVKQKQAKNYEIFDFPGEYKVTSDGNSETKIRMEEEELAFDQVAASSTCRTFGVGGKFTIGEHPSASEQGKNYVILSIQHSMVDMSATGTQGGAEYSNSFTCMPSSIVFRPPRITPKPIVSGLQSAWVVGPQGEEIYTDEYGRIKVHFHWDRLGKSDGTDTIWIRTSHSIAGKKWGFFTIPRIGQEVMIDFLEGDPDRPVCVSSVYNSDQMPHYELPANMTKTYFKTCSTKGGEGFNELCFEDLKDNERFFMHAQKDMDVRVLNVSRERIIMHRHQIIGNEEDQDGNQLELVYGYKDQEIKRSHQLLVGGHQLIKVGGDEHDGGVQDIWIKTKQRFQVGEGGKHQTIGGDYFNDVTGGYSMSVGGNSIQTVSGDISTKSTGDMKTKCANSHLKADMALHAKGGMTVAIEGGQAVHIKGGMSLVLEAGMSACLKVGGNFINVTSGGIFIQGTLVGINSGGAATSGGGCSPQDPETASTPETTEEATPETPEIAHDESSGVVSARS